MSARATFILWALTATLASADCACSSKRAPAPLTGDEASEDPTEEQFETPAQEAAEEALETGGNAGAGASVSVGGFQGGPGGSSFGGVPAGGVGNSTGAGGGAIAGASGASPGGAAGVANGGTSAVVGAGGAGNAGGFSSDGGSPAAGGSGPVTYPMLTASSFGAPTRIASTTAFTLAEGPLWDPCEHRLLFADVSASKIYSLTSSGQLSTFASNTGNTNGIAFDKDGSLILAQMVPPGHVSRRDKSGTITPLEPPGSRLHTPDDVTVRSDGVIYFTDGSFPPTGTAILTPLPVYALLPGAATLSNGGSVAGPNGVELSPDEKTLYVDAYFQGAVVKYSVNPDGTLTKGATLVGGLTNPDSLCLDAAGNLYVGVSTGLAVIRPDGSRVGLIPVPSAQGVTNCTFGGDDGKTLYITAWTALFHVDAVPIPGLEWMVNRKKLGCM